MSAISRSRSSSSTASRRLISAASFLVPSSMIAASLSIRAASRARSLSISSCCTVQRCSMMKRWDSLIVRAFSLETSCSWLAAANSSSLSSSSRLSFVARLSRRVSSAACSAALCRSIRAASSSAATAVAWAMSAFWRSTSFWIRPICLSFSAFSRASARSISASSSSLALAMMAISLSRRSCSSFRAFWISDASRFWASSVIASSRSVRIFSSSTSLPISCSSTALRWLRMKTCFSRICRASSLETALSWLARAVASWRSISSSSSWVSRSFWRIATVVRFSVSWTLRRASLVISVMIFRPSASNTLSVLKCSLPVCSRVTTVTSSSVRPLALKLSVTLALIASAIASRFSCSSLSDLVAA